MNKINSILNDIDSIDVNTAVAQESVLDSVCNYAQKEFDMMYCEYATLVESNDIYQEGVGELIKAGASKLIGLIKKGIEFLGRIITAIINFFKKLFGKEKKNVNNILLDDVLDSEDESSVVEAAENTSRGVTLFFVDVENDKFRIKLNPFAKATALPYTRSAIGTKDFPKTFDMMVVTMLKRPDLLDLLEDAIKCYHVENGKLVADPSVKEKHDHFCKEFNTLDDELTRHGETADQEKFDIRGLQAIQKKLNSISQYMDKLVFSDKSGYDDGDAYFGPNSTKSIAGIHDNPRKILETIQQDILNLSMGMNSFLSSVKDVYLVDKNLYGKIDSIGKMDKFIYLMMKNGYPSKVIADNIHYTIKDAVPKFMAGAGQTRYVIAPKDKDFVYKCAFNGVGVSANKTEKYVYTQYKNAHVGNLLAETIDIGKYNCVIKQERCDVNSKISDEEFNAYFKELNEAREKNDKLPIIGDRKRGNLGRHKNGDVCMVDYGMLSNFMTTVPTFPNA